MMTTMSRTDYARATAGDRWWYALKRIRLCVVRGRSTTRTGDEHVVNGGDGDGGGGSNGDGVHDDDSREKRSTTN